MRVEIDADLCTGHGRCYSLAPDVFDSDDAGVGVVRAPDSIVPEDLVDQVQVARSNCPEGAISCS